MYLSVGYTCKEIKTFLQKNGGPKIKKKKGKEREGGGGGGK